MVFHAFDVSADGNVEAKVSNSAYFTGRTYTSVQFDVPFFLNGFFTTFKEANFLQETLLQPKLFFPLVEASQTIHLIARYMIINLMMFL